MAENVQTTTVGDAQITIIDVYTIPERIDKLIALPEADRTPSNVARLDHLELLPVQCILIRLAGHTVLVDAGIYDAAMDHSGRTGYVPPTGLIARLAEAGVHPTDVEHVVITHGHGDHYNATTVDRNGEYELMFPGARYYLGRGDWERPALQDALKDPESLDSRTIGVLHHAGRLVPVEGDREIAPGITILASPGETPGHQGVRVTSEEQTLYCIGDLYHHRLEVDHPTWAVPWAEPATILASRTAFAAAAVAENARVVATHISGIGRLERTKLGVTWVTA
jgi:glyoxylase-like metal-dependent hydrolase (beta-lactamase superfamily II)